MNLTGHEVAAAMNLVLEEANERLKVPLRGLATWVGAHRVGGQCYARAHACLEHRCAGRSTATHPPCLDP